VIADILTEERPGCAVEYATEINTATSLIAANPYDLILLDIDMKKSAGGLIYTLKERGLFTRTYLVTENTHNPRIRELLSAGARGYLYKPFNIEELLAAVNTAGTKTVH